MNDFIDEINRDMRHDRWHSLWRKYGTYVIAVALLLVVLVAGRQGLVVWQESKHNDAANAYLNALESDGTDALAAIFNNGDGEGYPMLARFQYAARLAEAGDAAGAENAYLELSRDDSIGVVYRDAALMLSVLNAQNESDRDVLKSRLMTLARSDSAWRLLAGEILIGFALEEGDTVAAKQAINQLRDPPPPPGVERRLRMIETALGE